MFSHSKRRPAIKIKPEEKKKKESVALDLSKVKITIIKPAQVEEVVEEELEGESE